jgi:nucleoside-diphosphate-sugar epimerase
MRCVSARRRPVRDAQRGLRPWLFGARGAAHGRDGRRQALDIREEPRRAGDPAYLVARAERIRTELGWQPRYDDLEAIVASSLAWEKKLQARALGLEPQNR